MANPIFLDFATQKGGKITDPGQTKKNFKEQLMCQSFKMATSMALSSHKAHASSASRQDPITVAFSLGCYIPEFYQANLTGDRVTTATFTFPVTNKSGEETNSMTIKATGGIVSAVRFLSEPIWKSEHDSTPAIVEVDLAFEKLEVEDLIHNKQMSYSWDER